MSVIRQGVSVGWGRVRIPILRKLIRLRDRLSAIPAVPHRLQRGGVWFLCPDCGIKHKAGGVPGYWKPDGRLVCWSCHHRGPDATHRHYGWKLGWEQGECSRWPAEAEAESEFGPGANARVIGRDDVPFTFPQR